MVKICFFGLLVLTLLLDGKRIDNAEMFVDLCPSTVVRYC